MKFCTSFLKIFFLFIFFIIPYHSNAFGGIEQCPLDNNYSSYGDRFSFVDGCFQDIADQLGAFWNCEKSEFNRIKDNVYGADSNYQMAVDKAKGSAVRYFEGCLNEAKENQANCIKACTDYISHTSSGHCNINISHCSSICSSNQKNDQWKKLFTVGASSYNNPEGGTLRSMVNTVNRLEDMYGGLTVIEENIQNEREKCTEGSRENFIKKYATLCLRKISETEKKKGRTLLCKEGATRSQPGCEEYCQKQGENVHGDSLTAEEVINEHFIHQNNNRFREQLFNNGEIYKHRALINPNTDSVAISALNGESGVKKKGAIVDIDFDTGEIKEGDNSLSWLLCKKDASPQIMECESDLKVALSDAVKSCAELQSAAQECCHNPESCVGGGLASALDGLGKLHVGLSAFKGPQAQCDAVQQTHGLYSGMQGAMAAQCTNKSNECVTECGKKVQAVSEAFHAACDAYPHTDVSWSENEHTCDKKFFDDYKKAYTSSENEKQINISGVADKCKTTGKEANHRINDMTTNAGTSLLASMKECGWDGDNWKSSYNGGPTDMNILPSEKDNTNTGNNNPGGIQIPDFLDPTVTVGGGGNEEEKRREALPDGMTAQQAVSPFDMEPGLGPESEEGPPAPAGKMGGLLGGSGGGGGGGLGGLGGGGSSGGRGKAGSGRGAGKGKKVLLGYRGGKFKGYGGGAGGSSAGGSKASRGRSASKKRRGIAQVDLKKLLPKGKQLNNKIGKYGSPHDDIFKRLSDRIQWMCRTRKINCN